VAAQQRQNLEGQLDFFSLNAGIEGSANNVKEVDLPDIPEFTPQELMTMEKETTGLYLSGHMPECLVLSDQTSHFFNVLIDHRLLHRLKCSPDRLFFLFHLTDSC